VSPVDWMVFVNKQVPRKLMSTSNFQVDNCIYVFDTGGITQERLQPSGDYTESFGIQIMLRLNEFDDYVGYNKAKTIETYFDRQINRYNVTVADGATTDYLIHNYSRTSNIIRSNEMEDDSIIGLMYTLNFLMYVTQL
jgi:hypothetical protein